MIRLRNQAWSILFHAFFVSWVQNYIYVILFSGPLKVFENLLQTTLHLQFLKNHNI